MWTPSSESNGTTGHEQPEKPSHPIQCKCILLMTALYWPICYPPLLLTSHTARQYEQSEWIEVVLNPWARTSSSELLAALTYDMDSDGVPQHGVLQGSLQTVLQGHTTELVKGSVSPASCLPGVVHIPSAVQCQWSYVWSLQSNWIRPHLETICVSAIRYYWAWSSS